VTEPLYLPEWVLAYVGRLAVELESARRRITELEAPPPPAASADPGGSSASG
jgi:hypothetical protein